MSKSFLDQLSLTFPSTYILLKRNNGGLKNIFINIRGYKAIKKNNLFDERYYMENNKDVKTAGINPVIHYMYHGFKEGRKPSLKFDNKYYMKRYKDVRRSKLNPLVHYALYGKKEGRFINENHEFPVLTEEEVKARYNEIIEKNKSLINLKNFEDNAPLVSIIILTRNGLTHLKRLFKNFKKNIQYPSYEIIVVDNASTDDSLNFLEQLKDEFPLKIIKNSENKSFSEANNDGVKIANGEYVLLLNNDIEPTYGWLNEMMQTAMRTDNLGAVGAKLVYPNSSESSYTKKKSFKIQHIGIAFKERLDGTVLAYNMGNGLDPFDPESNDEKLRAGVTAAVLMVKKEVYEKVKGLDESYHYGYEDVDFCLKLLKAGYNTVYCPKALLFHYENGTLKKNKQDRRAKLVKYNTEVLIKKWNEWVIKEILKDKLENKGLISEKPLKIVFIDDNKSITMSNLVKSLGKCGWDVDLFNQRKYEIWNDTDVLISSAAEYDPVNIKGSKKELIKIAIINDHETWESNSDVNNYDFIITTNLDVKDYLKELEHKIIFISSINADSFKETLKTMLLSNENKI